MSLEDLKRAKERTVGSKQTWKALLEGRLSVVFIAADAERRVVKPIMDEAKRLGVPIHLVESRKLLGIACGIEVDTAIAGVLRKI